MAEDENVHTSVVIELDKNDLDDEKMYGTDFNQKNIPKDYMVDQIFCGENITVYALFEISEESKKKLNKNNPDALMQRNFNSDPYTTSYNEVAYNVLDNPTDSYTASKELSKEKSYYCLKHLNGCYNSRRVDDYDMKVIYSKNNSRTELSEKTKTASMGINTDIAFCPKLVDEVHNAINMNFSFINPDRKPTMSSLNSFPKSSLLSSESTSSSNVNSLKTESNNSKYSTNVFVVPLVMDQVKYAGKRKEDKGTETSQDEDEDNEMKLTGVNLSKEYEIAPKICDITSNFTHLKVEMNLNKERNVSGSSMEKLETRQKNSKTNASVSNETILEELRQMQIKLREIAKSLEISELRFNSQNVDPICEINKDLEKPINEEDNEVKKVSDLEMFRSDDYVTFQNNLNIASICPIKFLQYETNKDNNENAAVISSDSLTILDVKKKEMNIESKFFGMNADHYQKNCVVHFAKSDSKIHFASFEIKPVSTQNVRKSQSLDLNNEKIAALCAKKIKNASYKQPDSVLNGKANLGTIEISPPAKVGLMKRKIGDEMPFTAKKHNADNEETNRMKEEILAITKKVLEEKSKAPNEEKPFDSFYEKHRLSLQHFLYKDDKFPTDNCNPVASSTTKCFKNTTPTEKIGGLQEVIDNNSTDKKRLINIKNEASSLNEMKNVPLDAQTDVKKHFRKPEDKNGKMKKREETRLEKTSLRGVKFPAKTLLNSNTALEKSVKNNLEYSTLKPENFSHCSKKKNSIGEKTPGKNDWVQTRPPSQKNKRDSASMSSNEIKDKNIATFLQKCNKSYSSNNRMKKCSVEKILHREQTKQILVFDQKAENIYLTDASAPSSQIEVQSAKSKPVIVELFSKKPNSVDLADGFNTNSSCKSSTCNIMSENSSANTDNSYETEKPVIKSVWALTKVLLYSDGTKKFEILEASLTPPGYGLKNNNLIPNNSQ